MGEQNLQIRRPNLSQFGNCEGMWEMVSEQVSGSSFRFKLIDGKSKCSVTTNFQPEHNQQAYLSEDEQFTSFILK